MKTFLMGYCNGYTDNRFIEIEAESSARAIEIFNSGRDRADMPLRNWEKTGFLIIVK